MPDFLATAPQAGLAPITIVKGGHFATAATTRIVLWTPASGKRPIVYGVVVSCNSAIGCSINGSTYGNFSGVFGVSNSNLALFLPSYMDLFVANETIGLTPNAATATNWAYSIWGIEA